MSPRGSAAATQLGLATEIPMLPLTSWDEVDNEIGEAARLALAIEDRENELNQRLQAAQNEYGPGIKALKEESALVVDRILTFAKKHRKDFGDKKSRKFNFGKIEFSKTATKVKLLLEELHVIANLKKLGLATGVVKEKEWVDLNALRDTIPEEKRTKVGFELEETGDVARLVIDKKSIEILRKARQPRRTS
jgi:phage host-nuclease inhibitor protein Gam